MAVVNVRARRSDQFCRECIQYATPPDGCVRCGDTRIEPEFSCEVQDPMPQVVLTGRVGKAVRRLVGESVEDAIEVQLTLEAMHSRAAEARDEWARLMLIHQEQMADIERVIEQLKRQLARLGGLQPPPAVSPPSTLTAPSMPPWHQPPTTLDSLTDLQAALVDEHGEEARRAKRRWGWRRVKR